MEQNRKLSEINSQTLKFGKFDEEISLIRLIESHN